MNWDEMVEMKDLVLKLKDYYYNVDERFLKKQTIKQTVNLQLLFLTTTIFIVIIIKIIKNG